MDRWLAEHSNLSRSEAKAAVRAKRVKVDCHLAISASQKVDSEAVILVDNELVAIRVPQYVMLHKPLGVICATIDGLHQTVIDLLPPAFKTLHPVGRLDKETTGLVILTDDGQWSHRVAHPKYNCEKRYLVTTKWPIPEATIERLLAGVVLRDDPTPVAAKSIDRLADNQLMITISEGRYHQVRRMIAACENRVMQLHRTNIGSLELDISEGEWRQLTPEEVSSLA
ncbi:ribosomal small subunit pseudouridine synthase A [Umboniibacter marinipuniceus]|uniref:Pseudouridine synthase n=1 Tax=Umboniibacter marinipuniceus TaxID=569599 RepID=A0A3M0ACA6_9GAMM|nr:ribosomal small subunit pseudouridine synthase A [Umboniibacter marinipuniceus]